MFELAHEIAGDDLRKGVSHVSLRIDAGANKVRRGMSGVIRDDRHAGGRAYGYRLASDRTGELENCRGRGRCRPAYLFQPTRPAGRIVWNKVRMVKIPDTGKRISRPNPRGHWPTIATPQLRIVDEDTWARVQALKAEKARLSSGRSFIA